MNLILIKPTINDEDLFTDMMMEWEKVDERITPGSLKNYKPNFSEFISLLENCHNGIGIKDYQVPSTLYILKDIKRNILLGASSMRHKVNKDLELYGGHIGYGIRPSERNKGYATELLRLTLEKAKTLHSLKEVLVSCDKDNIASSKVIQNNNGILQYVGFYEPVGKEIERYKIII